MVPVGAAVAVVLFVALLVWADVSLFFEIDGCLDRGGRWVTEAAACEGARPAAPDPWPMGLSTVRLILLVMIGAFFAGSGVTENRLHRELNWRGLRPTTLFARNVAPEHTALRWDGLLILSGWLFLAVGLLITELS